MKHCQPWLDCDLIEEQIQLTEKDVGNGLGKMFSKAEYDGQKVAFIRTREDKLTSGKSKLRFFLDDPARHTRAVTISQKFQSILELAPLKTSYQTMH